MAWFWQTWLVAVVFIFPIPHTIALRNLLLLIGLLALLPPLTRATRLPLPPALKPAAWGLAAATAWLLLHSLAVAPAPTVALDNLRGDWLQPILTAALAAFASSRIGPNRAIQSIIAALLGHMLWVFGWQLMSWVDNGMATGWPVSIIPFGQNDYQSSLNGFLLSILVAERLAVQLAGLQVAVIAARSGWVGLAISFLADAALRSRNGTVVSVVLLLATTVWIGLRSRRMIFLAFIAIALGSASVALDPRWSGLKESLAIGWNSHSQYWLHGNKALRPPTPSGAVLEESAYARAAWAHQAVLAIGEHPLGLGFGRDGFGRAMAEKYGYPGMVSSHSGWLDFALAAGLPGLVLLLLTAGLAMRGGWRQFRQHHDAAGLMFCFLIGGYLLRCLLDGHFSGWRLGLFAFICGVLIAAMKPAPRQT
ncbi:MAG: hypothetical protein A3H93_06875 [Rhodocyclales bacterium RIFCSPLOWO2_02_FULL_63_24]|nr:MAG: hypothetical protein A2040_17865 [Rhodocyclales bacterium GWA2_65_19]OHC68262.1 MAG: hypothetical protein A3H93_06875 [Rhodocyclales bacterium RIFCSPLOWO2_02_FULL_63_24]